MSADIYACTNLASKVWCARAEHTTWKCPKKGADDPPALAGHSLTAVGQHGIYLFGGSGGKRPSAETYCCDPDTLAWRRVDTMGVRRACSCGSQLPWEASLPEH